MSEKVSTVTVFCSADSSEFAEAVHTLNAEDIAHRIVAKNEGGIRLPETVHYIRVDAQDEHIAREALAHLPNELLLKHKPDLEPLPENHTLSTWLRLITILVGLIILYFVGKRYQ